MMVGTPKGCYAGPPSGWLICGSTAAGCRLSCHATLSLTACWLLLCAYLAPPQGSDYISSLSLGDEHDAGNHTPGSHSHSLCSAADMDPAMREAVVANAAAAAVTAFASAAAATSSGGGEQAGMQLPPVPSGGQPCNGVSDAGDVAVSSRQSGNNSPPRQYSYLPGRPPSFHDLARAMREFHEQQMAEMAEARSREAAVAAATPVANGVGHGVGELGSFHSGALNTPLDSPPLVEVKLPNGALNPTVLAKVAATAATAAASALNEVMPQRNGQTATTPVCTIASYSNCKEEHS